MVTYYVIVCTRIQYCIKLKNGDITFIGLQCFVVQIGHEISWFYETS
jgi:hypothetical protein